MSDSVGLVDFTSGLVNSVLNLPVWQIPFFQVARRLGITAKWFERMRSLFFSEVFMDVAVVGSYSPYLANITADTSVGQFVGRYIG